MNTMTNDQWTSNVTNSIDPVEPDKPASQWYLNELMTRGGFSLTQIASTIGIPYATVRRLALGVNRRSTDNVFRKILGLYCQVFYRVKT